MRHRSNHQINLFFLIWMIIFAIMLCSAGVCYGVLRNEQINVMRDIEEMNNEIASSKLATEHYKAQIASNASRWAIRDRLAQDKSTLQEIQPQQIESIHAPTNQPTMASK